jgi:hypothetical protein
VKERSDSFEVGHSRGLYDVIMIMIFLFIFFMIQSFGIKREGHWRCCGCWRQRGFYSLQVKENTRQLRVGSIFLCSRQFRSRFVRLWERGESSRDAMIADRREESLFACDVYVLLAGPSSSVLPASFCTSVRSTTSLP